MKTRRMMKMLMAAGLSAVVPMITLAEDPVPNASTEKSEKKHEGKKEEGPHAAGKITAIDAKHIEIKTKAGETVSVKLDATTHYGNRKEAKMLSDFHVGDLAFVAYEEAKDGTKTAKHVGTPHKAEKGSEGPGGTPPADGSAAPKK